MAKAPPPRLGELAVHNRLLTPERLAECLGLQDRLAALGYFVRLGQILVEKHYLGRPALSALLRAQRRVGGKGASQADTTVGGIRLAPADQELLAERLEKKEAMPPDSISACREIEAALQKGGIEKHWTELALELGYITTAQATILLEHPEQVRTGSFQRFGPEDAENSGFQPRVEALLDPELLKKSRELRIGRLAIAKGFASREKVEECLGIQVLLKELGVNKRLGEILFRKEYLTGPALARLLDLQARQLSSIRWAECAREERPADPEDRALAELLVARGHLTQDEIRECFHVQRVMREMGFDRNLKMVVADKEFLPRRVVEAIWLQRPAAPRSVAPIAASETVARATPAARPKEPALRPLGPAPAPVQAPAGPVDLEVAPTEEGEHCPSCWAAVRGGEEVCRSCGLPIYRYTV
ncbi:MAG: hypothetical protein HY720_02050 [Planctomycetes bacterium]|nr:hypothetical protein [Planctomycetota bacterium]